MKGRIDEMSKEYIGFAGTYTREKSEGIYRFVLDTEASTLKEVEVAAQVGSPTYVTLSEDLQRLYAVAQDGEQGGVAAYDVSKAGELTEVNRLLAAGAPPCHLTVNEQALVTSNYHKGTVQLLSVDETGVAAEVAVATHDGTGPHERQEKPHVHYTAHTPDNKYIVAADLGTDELVTYQVQGETLVRVSTLHVKPGSGPRHVAFHPNGTIAYLLTELSSEVLVLAYDAETGTFTEEQTLLAIPEDFTETNDASAIRVSSDGKFLYTGNRGHNSIALFAINETNQHLTFVEHTQTGGEWPRDFVLDPSEAYVVAANQHSGNLVLFHRDKTTGKLTPAHSEIAVPEAVCVTFLS